MISVLNNIKKRIASGEKMLAVLIDPDKFEVSGTAEFLRNLPPATTHIMVGGSTVKAGRTDIVLRQIKKHSSLSVLLFPGDWSQITPEADVLLFLSLISGRNPEYLIGQQVKAVPMLQKTELEIIPTGYLLIDGGKETAVQKVTGTLPLSQADPDTIIHTAIAGKLSGKKMIYLEAGSGARFPVGKQIISRVKTAVDLPLIVGGGIRSQTQLDEIFRAGADMVVIGTAFEQGNFFGPAGSSAVSI